MAAEIAEQPACLARRIESDASDIEQAASAIRAFDPDFVIFAARGTSDHAALYAKYLFETRVGLAAGLASPSSMTVYGSTPRLNKALWIAVSQSGSSPDLVESTRLARQAGALTVAVTNAPESDLSAASAHGIDVMAGPEMAVAATKSYTSELVSLYLLVARLLGRTSPELDQIPALARTVLDENLGSQMATRLRFADALITTGRGFAFPNALEAALKLMETSYLSAHGFSSADLMHGPMAMVDPDRPVVAIVPPGTGGQAMVPAMDRLRDRGADLTVVGNVAPFSWAQALVPLPDLDDEALAAMLQILPLQQLALSLARARGHDPDRPRGLAKVTETV